MKEMNFTIMWLIWSISSRHYTFSRPCCFQRLFLFFLFPKRIRSNTWHKNKKYLNVKRDDKHKKKIKLKKYFIQHTECSFITSHQFSRLLYFICFSWINDYDVSKIDFIVVWYLNFRCSYLMKSMCNAYKNINN